MKTRLNLLTLAAACLALLSAIPVNLCAATLTVTTANDSGPGSLRAALAFAGNGDIINFAVPDTIILTNGELVISENLTIAGPGATNLAISGNSSSRVFNIDSGVTVTISGLTICNGRVPNGTNSTTAGVSGGPGANGGGIYNAGLLTLSECVLTNNHAGSGGDGRRGADGDFGRDPGDPGDAGSGGGVGGSGGGIYNSSLAVLQLEACTLAGNSSGNGGLGADGGKGGSTPAVPGMGGAGGPSGTGGNGGGFFNAGIATINRSTITANFNGTGAGGGAGGAGGECQTGFGGIRYHWGGNGGTGGEAAAGGSGGGIYGTGETTVTDSTISGNTTGRGGNGGIGGNGGYSHGIGVDYGHVGAGGNAGASGSGGGIDSHGTLHLVRCTIVQGRTAAGGLGGFHGEVGSSGGPDGIPGSAGRAGGVNSASAQPPSLINTIVARNTRTNTTPDDVFGAFASLGHNLVGTTTDTTGFGTNGDLLNLDPELGPLADNGGPTLTYAPSATSPVINAGCNSLQPETDQRGMPRIMGGTIDIGACEFQSPQSLICYAWLHNYGLSTDGSADYLDADGDHMNNWQEWQADTSPVDANDFLHITSFTRSSTHNTLSWTSKSTRLYQVERSASFDASSPWETIFTNDVPGWNNVGFDNTGSQYFYRIRAVRP